MVEFGAERGERGADGLRRGREGFRRGVASRGGEAGDEGGGEEGDDGEVGRFGAGEEGGGGGGLEEGGEGVGQLGEALEGVGAVAEGRFVRLGWLVFLGRLVAEEVGELLGEEGEVRAFILRGLAIETSARGRGYYREAGSEADKVLDGRAVVALEVGERAVVYLMDKGCVVGDFPLKVISHGVGWTDW